MYDGPNDGAPFRPESSRSVRRTQSARAGPGHGNGAAATRADGSEIGVSGMTQTDLLKHILERENQGWIVEDASMCVCVCVCVGVGVHL